MFPGFFYQRRFGEVDPNSDLSMLSVGKIAHATCSLSTFAKIEILRVDQRSFENIDDELAIIEGFTKGDELKSALLDFYSDSTLKTVFNVFYFKVVPE